MAKGKCGCKHPLSPHPFHACAHPLKEHPGYKRKTETILGEVVLDEAMGGEVAALIREWVGVEVQCYGICHSVYKVEELLGYDHEGGVADASGKRWWAYSRCPNCERLGTRYETSFRHLPAARARAEDERRRQALIAESDAYLARTEAKASSH